MLKARVGIRARLRASVAFNRRGDDWASPYRDFSHGWNELYPTILQLQEDRRLRRFTLLGLPLDAVVTAAYEVHPMRRDYVARCRVYFSRNTSAAVLPPVR